MEILQNIISFFFAVSINTQQKEKDKTKTSFKKWSTNKKSQHHLVNLRETPQYNVLMLNIYEN